MTNILILCTGNSCRSIMAEGLLRHYGNSKFHAFSAGSNPTGKVHPISLKTLEAKSINTEGFYSKSWDALANKQIDIVITVCDNAAGETCPIFLGQAIKTHWGVPDPAHFTGSEAEISAEFRRVCEILERRIKALCALDISAMQQHDVQAKLDEIGTYE